MKGTWIGRGWLLLLLVLCTWGEGMAQKMKVESFVEFSQAEDPDAKDPTFRRKDTQTGRNDRYCAIIKVVTTEKGFNFDLGTDLVPEGDVVYTANGEIWIYVPVGASKIKISHPRYGQFDTRDGYYSFKEAGVPKCKEATVYRLRLHTDFNPDEDIIKDANKFATVKFWVHPAAATVLLRKVPETVGDDGTLEKLMPLGIYHYRVTHPDYHDFDGTFELESENETKRINLKLNQAFGWLALDPGFKPSGYTFTVDGQITTASSLKRMALRSGAHTVEVQHPDYHPQTLQVVIRDSAVYELSPRLQPRVGRLLVTTNKPGAIVSVDGEQIGITPLEDTYELMIGEHTVEVSCANHRTEKRSVTIKEDQTTNLPITLVDMARFRFSSTPSAAWLYINGEYIGSTPCYAELTSGDYRVKLMRRRYHTIDKRMYFDSSNPEVSFRMLRQYQQKKQFYLQPSFHYGTQMRYGGTMGFYLANVNVEAACLFGKKSDPIYWNYIGEQKERPVKEIFSPVTIAMNAGYGFIFGTRFRLTPQIGVNAINLEGTQKNHCSALTVSVGARAEYIVANHLGICLAPDYSFPAYKSDNFLRISETLSQLNEYAAGGLSLKMGVYLYF